MTEAASFPAVNLSESRLDRIRRLQVEAHTMAKEKGWWEKPRPKGEVFALIHSEISEALEAYRVGKRPDETWFLADGKPEGIPSEIADVVIRVFDYAGHRNLDIVGAIPSVPASTEKNLFSEHLNDLHVFVASTSISDEGLAENLAEIVNECEVIASLFGFDLWKMVETKMAYNRTRPRRHGGKVA